MDCLVRQSDPSVARKGSLLPSEGRGLERLHVLVALDFLIHLSMRRLALGMHQRQLSSLLEMRLATMLNLVTAVLAYPGSQSVAAGHL